MFNLSFDIDLVVSYSTSPVDSQTSNFCSYIDILQAQGILPSVPSGVPRTGFLNHECDAHEVPAHRNRELSDLQCQLVLPFTEDALNIPVKKVDPMLEELEALEVCMSIFGINFSSLIPVSHRHSRRTSKDA